MPNNTEYGNSSLNGTVAFMADNATIEATENVAGSQGDNFTLVPSYDIISPSPDVYALNVSNKFGSYSAGSVFVPEKYNVNPFSAYITATASTQGAPLFRIQMQDEAEEDIAYDFTVTVRGGTVYVTLPEARSITVYDMVGRKVCTIDGQEGINEIGHLSEGVYMIEKTKIYVKR